LSLGLRITERKLQIVYFGRMAIATLNDDTLPFKPDPTQKFDNIT
jgi:hypothetical protein